MGGVGLCRVVDELGAREDLGEGFDGAVDDAAWGVEAEEDIACVMPFDFGEAEGVGEGDEVVGFGVVPAFALEEGFGAEGEHGVADDDGGGGACG